MSYSSETRVTHVNEVAGVPSSLVATAVEHGHNWRFRPLTPARPPMLQATLRRAADIPRWFRERRNSDLLHIHYGPNGYLGWGASAPTVLHLHGSDVRSDLQRTGVGALTRKAIQKADVVLYATTDLEDAVRTLRPDALWLPNPLPREVLDRPVLSPASSERVIFATRWDWTKGAEKLAQIAKVLTAHGIDCHGLDWGADTTLAREAGVILHPLMSTVDYFSFLASARLVIGQVSFGVPGLSELQTMAMGLPVAMHAPGIPVFQTGDPDSADAVLTLYGDDSRIGTLALRGQEWALAHHDPDRVFEQLVSYYSTILSV